MRYSSGRSAENYLKGRSREFGWSAQRNNLSKPTDVVFAKIIMAEMKKKQLSMAEIQQEHEKLVNRFQIDNSEPTANLLFKYNDAETGELTFGLSKPLKFDTALFYKKGHRWTTYPEIDLPERLI